MKRYLEYIAESKTPQSGYIKENNDIKTNYINWIDINGKYHKYPFANLDNPIIFYSYNELSNKLKETEQLFDAIEGIEFNFDYVVDCIKNNLSELDLMFNEDRGPVGDVYYNCINFIRPIEGPSPTVDGKFIFAINKKTNITSLKMHLHHSSINAGGNKWFGVFSYYVDRKSNYIKNLNIIYELTADKIIDNPGLLTKSDIKKMLNKYPKIKEIINTKQPNLGTAVDWGLI